MPAWSSLRAQCLREIPAGTTRLTEDQLISEYSPLLRTYLNELELAACAGPILDLACGAGHNGLYLIKNNIPVVFADVRLEALGQVQATLKDKSLGERYNLASFWQVDLELPGAEPFADRLFGGILVYNYLHRPLLESLKRAVLPGGLLIYETFTTGQAKFGRPGNPDFLLRPGELRDCFREWDVLHYFEGVVESDSGNGAKAIAQLVAKKPALS